LEEKGAAGPALAVPSPPEMAFAEPETASASRETLGWTSGWAIARQKCVLMAFSRSDNSVYNFMITNATTYNRFQPLARNINKI
jgi:hypothetical protein